MHSRYIRWPLIVIGGAALLYTFAFPGLVHASPPRDPRCQVVVIQPHRSSSYTYLARQCGNLRLPPVGDRWAEIGTRSRHIDAVPVPVASPTPSVSP